MKIIVENRTGEKIPGVNAACLEKCVSEILRITDDSEVSLFFVSADEIRKTNKLFRKIDKVTDVLSFPNHDKKPFTADSDGQIRLGDILLCLSFVRDRSEKKGLSTRDEIIRMIVHGVLHLVGYDHDTVLKEKDMEIKANIILNCFKSCL